MSELLKPCWCGAPAKQKRNDIVVCSLVSRHGYAYDTEEWNSRAPAAPGLLREVGEELQRAQQKYAPIHGPHEGYAVILEELDELWVEVKAQIHDQAKMRKEALQVAAMALRFIADVCDAHLSQAEAQGQAKPAPPDCFENDWDRARWAQVGEQGRTP